MAALKYEDRDATNSRGFTLVELLVVIAVISVLMSVLLPSLSMARKQAKSATCSNNLRQIGTAACLYAEDYDERIPRGHRNSEDIGIDPWYILFMPYLSQDELRGGNYQNVEIFRCPAYPDREQTLGYVINAWRKPGAPLFEQNSWVYPTKLTVIVRPTNKIYLADNEHGSWRAIIKNARDPDIGRNDVCRPSHLPMSNDTRIGSGRRVARDRHKQGCNTMFMDWHAEYCSSEEMDRLQWILER